ncbi:hypothetical protein LTR53_012021 [Teratosphaeriaceae sp. CCFEE 6253]|nr:hypothetical protein LTR53_012021 [Teratosphaeriaceae sp. CCFEE 6253]
MLSGYDEEPLIEEEALVEVRVSLGGAATNHHELSPSASPEPGRSGSRPGPDIAVIFEHLDASRQDLVQSHLHPNYHLVHEFVEGGPPNTRSMDPELPEHAATAKAPPDGTVPIRPTEAQERHDSANALLAAQALEVTTSAGAEEEISAASRPPAQPSADSVQRRSETTEPSHRAPLLTRSSLTLDTSTSRSQSADTITDSPTLSKHVIPAPHGNKNTLPVVQPTSPNHERNVFSSPTKLPSFQQFTGQLDTLAEAAEAAATHEPRAPVSHSRHHSHSFSSTTAPSPRLPYHSNPYPGGMQTSPASQYAYSARSPTSTISEMVYGSPTAYSASAAYFADRRRSSIATDHTGAYAMPASLPSASSTESHGHASSSAENYSTANTTPVDRAALGEGTPRAMPILPPPPGMPPGAVMMHTGFECDEPECNAPPFQTQYLLSSHKNVHSSQRPYFCAVRECSRSEGGKGFKRKNEMIRHGLVHNSPGYVCPFCPDREHRYPRPDNLQRHVRVHHVDKDRDDPALREVLAQRIEGAGKQRRRRTNAHGSISKYARV